MRSQTLKRLLSLALCLCMVTGLLPVTALAADQPVITTETLEGATVGELYNATLTATPSDQNGTLSWTASGLPTWLALINNSDGTATLDGTPTEAGEVKFTVTVTETIPAEPEEPAQGTDPAGETAPAEPIVLTASKEYTLTVGAPANEPEADPGAEPGAEPESEPGAEPGNEPNRGTEPEAEPGTEPGADSLLTGGGSTRGSYTLKGFTAKVWLASEDNKTGENQLSAFQTTDTLYVNAAPFGTAPYWTDPASLALLDATLDVTEENCNSSAIHIGVGYNNNGTIGTFGSSPQTGLEIANFQLLDWSGYPIQVTEGKSYRFVVWDDKAGAIFYSTNTFTVTSGSGTVSRPTIVTNSLPDGAVSKEYEATLTANPTTTGGTLTWSVSSGNLPAGLQLGESTGTISGTPTAAGSYTFTVQVTETPTDGGEALTATKQFTLAVTAKLEITNDQTSFNLTRGEPFTLKLTANQPVTWRFQSGYMPGLRLSGDTISGTVSSYTSSGTYTATMRATAEDGQTADITFTFIVGNLYAFTLPESLSKDMIGHYAYLRAKLDNKQVTLWSGALSSPSQKLTVYSAYSGKTVSNVELYVRLNKGGNVEAVLAEAAGSVTLEDGGSSGLTAASTDSIIALPEFDYGKLDGYVSAWFEDSDGYRYYSGDLATNGMTFTLEVSANASQYRRDGYSGYDLNGVVTFSGNGVSGTDYTPSAGTITVTYPQLTKQNVTFTLVPVSGEGDDLTGAELSIQQYVNGAAIRTPATIESGNIATAELYFGLDTETTVTLTRVSNCALADPVVSLEAETTNYELEYWTSAQTGISLLLTPTLKNNSEELLTYAECLTRNSIYPTITVGGKSWNGRGSFSSSLSVTKSIGKPLSFGIWNYDYADEIQSMVDSGETYSLSWSATQNLLDGKLENQKWPSDQLSASVELPINLKGGVLLSLTYSGSSAAHLQDWWYDLSSNTWITSGNRTSVYSPKGEARNYAFCCPGKEGKYNFILLPREVQPTGMTWDDAAKYYADMPDLANVTVKNNTVVSDTFRLSEVQAAAARYLTLPNSTLSGPAQFTSTEELLSFTGGIQLDEGVDGKLKTLRIEARGDDGKVAFQISSLQIGGKTYPYAGIHIDNVDIPFPEDKLMNEQFTTYYEITFSEPITLPCTFTLYGNAMSYNSDVKLTLSAVLGDVTGVETSKLDQWQSLGTVTAQGPALSVAIPAAVGTDTATAYLTIPGPSSARVDIYDGDTLVVPSARAGEVEIPLVGTSPSRTTSHNLSFRWRPKPPVDASGEPYEVTVLHTNGLPTLVSQQLQVQVKTNWHTYERDRIYSFASSDPNPFRAVCEIANYGNIQGGKNGVTFLFHLLDGTTVAKSVAEQQVHRFTSETLNTNSPVIAVSVVFETDWTKVNEILQEAMRPVPANSPTETGAYNFDQTIVLSYDEYRSVIPQVAVPAQNVQFTSDEQAAIRTLQERIEQLYVGNNGDAGYYTIIGDGSEFFGGRYMIEELNPGVLPEGYTGETTFTRPLTPQQLDGELGGGDGWTRLTFVEPGEDSTGWGGTGEGGTTGLEIYTTEFTTDSGVTGTITIARIGTGDDARIIETGTATARGTGTGGGTPTSLPESDTINPGDAGGQNLFSFTTFRGPSDMEVFTNWCDDTGAAAGITGSLLEILGMEGAGGAWNVLGGIGNVLGAVKSFSDGIANSMSLSELHAATLQLLSSRCAQKLPSGVYNSLDSQIRNFSEMAIEAMAWNGATSMGSVGTGLAGAAGIMSNPWTAFTAGVALLGGSWINRQQMDNVRNEAQLIQDSVQFQITKNAMATGDEECMPKGRSQGNTAPYRVCIDPSGIVYEAVLSNPVVDATVALYTADGNFVPQYAKDTDTGLQSYVDEDGKPIKPSNASSAGSPKLTTPNADDLIPNELILTTGADGRFQWNVQQGLWYVTAYKEGYQSGNSGNDVAAVVKAGNLNWLPVAPEQLNVNIPLVSLEPPTVTAEAREDGVYLTFSKYMDESTLVENNFSVYIVGQDTAIVPVSVEKLNSEQAPGNIDYNGADAGYGTAPSYTSQVKLAVADGTTLSGDVTVTIGNGVLSYAGTPCETGVVTGAVQSGALVEMPAVDVSGGEVAQGTAVKLTIPSGAVVYYTTDGTDPSKENGTLYYEGQSIFITKTMTLKAVAWKYGTYSDIFSVTYTVPGTGGGQTPDPTPGTGSGGGGGGGSGDNGYSISVPASSSIKGGSITVSPRSAEKGDTVTITVKPDDGYELDTLTVTDSKGKEVALTDKGNGKYTFTMPGSNVKIEVSFKEIAEQVTNPFADVYESDYYYDAVLWAVANGVTNGTSATTFSPGVTVTRAQMVTFLWRAYGSPKATGSNPFADVSADAWYYDAVLWAVANGVTVGTSATTFSPDAPVTRSQAVTFQWRAAGSPVVTGDSFDDVAADAYYAGAVTWAVANGITNGTGGNQFSPDVVVTRAQAVTFLWRELA